VKLLPVLVILTAITVIGINGNLAYSESGVAQISDITAQGGVGFDVLDPDGVESVVFISNTQGATPSPTENIPNPSCITPLEMLFGFFSWDQNNQNIPGPSIFEITDCSTPSVTYTCEVFHDAFGGQNSGTCIAEEPAEPPVVGGEFLPIDSTALLLAGLQSSAIWMLPVLAGAAGAGFAAFKLRRK